MSDRASKTRPSVDTGHPFLDLSVRTALAHIDATFRGDHPKCGTGTYAQNTHDGFPPTIIAAVNALSAWGLNGRAARLFRYWPELLSSGLLPGPMANRMVEARLTAGGQFCGLTRFAGHLDDWPLADYLYGLWTLGRKNDFLLSLYGHIAYHQAEGHLTAYEQVSFPPGRKKADDCLPCQLVAARAARLLQA